MPRRWVRQNCREQPRTSPFPCLALSGPQRPSPAVGNANHGSPAWRSNFGPDPLMADGSDERSKYSQRHDSAAALRLSGNDGRRARRVRTRHSSQKLRARIRRTIRAQWSMNVAWATASTGLRRRRPLARKCGPVRPAARTAAVAASVRWMGLPAQSFRCGFDLR